MIWSVLNLSLSCAGDPVVLECPSVFPEPQTQVSECAGPRIPECCVALYGESQDYEGFISSDAAKCIASAWGLSAGEPTYFARPSSEQGTWAVHRIFPYDCPGSLGSAPGCVVFMDAYSGAFLYEGETFRTVSCQ